MGPRWRRGVDRRQRAAACWTVAAVVLRPWENPRRRRLRRRGDRRPRRPGNGRGHDRSRDRRRRDSEDVRLDRRRHARDGQARHADPVLRAAGVGIRASPGRRAATCVCCRGRTSRRLRTPPRLRRDRGHRFVEAILLRRGLARPLTIPPKRSLRAPVRTARPARGAGRDSGLWKRLSLSATLIVSEA